MGGETGRAERPRVTPELASAVSRLAQVREQLKVLETEETILRDSVVRAVADWSPEWFPLRIAGHELRRQERAGRLDLNGARAVLDRLGLVDRLPQEPRLKDVQEASRFKERVSQLGLSPGITAVILEAYDQVIEWVPEINLEEMRMLRESGQLADSDYRAMFKDQKPSVMVLVVR